MPVLVVVYSDMCRFPHALLMTKFVISVRGVFYIALFGIGGSFLKAGIVILLG